MPAWRKAAALIAAASLLAGQSHAQSWFASWQRFLLERQIHKEFPGVPQIGTNELAEWLHDPLRAKPLLLDVRTAAEFDVSHLAHARRIEPDADAAAVELFAGKRTPIVTYCAVGYRSAAFAGKLREAGFINVQNLDGSIFKWANEGRPLVRGDGQPAKKVHPYDATWGRLLNAGRRAPL